MTGRGRRAGRGSGQRQRQPPSPAGGCPAGSAPFSAPFADYPQVPDACYRTTGQPVTITSAAVAMSYQPATNQQAAVYGLNLTVPAAQAPALAAITTRSFDSRDPVAISTAGRTWDVTMTAGPLSNGQFGPSSLPAGRGGQRQAEEPAVL